MSLDTDLYTKLAALVSLPVQQNTISEDKAQPYVWFQRRNQNTDLFVAGTSALTEANYDVEVSGFDVDSVNSNADTIKTALNGFHGTMGSTFVLGSFVNDASDDYIFQNLDADQGNHVAAFNLEIII